METKKEVMIWAMLLLCLPAFSQSIQEDRKGCVSSEGNIAASYLFAQKQVGAYFAGEGELFVDHRVSMVGSVWFSLPTLPKNKAGVKMNHALYWGINYHFTKKGVCDPYVGLTPGLGLVSVVYPDGESLTKTKPAAVPLVSAQLGCNFFIGSFFHFFAKVQGVSGQLLKDVPTSKRLDELKIAAGLGWNLRLWKPKS